MGDKGIKAIAVRGTKDINVAQPAEFMRLCNEVLQYIKFRERESGPGRMPILQGLGSPQEMKHIDEAWHTAELHVGECPGPEKRLLDQGNGGEVEGDPGKRGRV